MSCLPRLVSRSMSRSDIGAKSHVNLGFLVCTGCGAPTLPSRRLGSRPYTVVPCVFELRQKALVVEARRRECRVTGQRCIAWRVIS